MIERAAKELPLYEQANLLSISRCSLYYVARLPDAREVAIKPRMDELVTNDPCLDRALCKATPTINNSDQGSHFTSPQFVKRLLDKAVAVRMEGQGPAMDHIVTERLWQTVKLGSGLSLRL